MSDQRTILRLVEDVGGVKADVRNMARAQDEQWKKIDRIMDAVNECNRKLDKTVELEERLEDAEKGVDDYRATKNRAMSMIAGIGIGGGGIGGAVSAWLYRWFGGNGG